MTSQAASDPAETPLPRSTDALADLARLERFRDALGQAATEQSLQQLVLSKPRPGRPAEAADLHRIDLKPLVVKGRYLWSLRFQHATRDITQNLTPAEVLTHLGHWLGHWFSQANLQTRDETLQVSISKRGKVGFHRARVQAGAGELENVSDSTVPTGHRREKRHLLTLDLPFLAALGVTDRQGHLVPAMARKWKQINKFVEVLDHALDEAGLNPQRRPEGLIRVLDFGAGKGYLTFATHHLLSQLRGWPVDVVGVELRPDLVATCNAAVVQCGLSGLRFECGDVRSVAPAEVDVMIALHACDIATDHALNAGVRAHAAVILSSPCCHKELRPQLHSPEPLQALLRHGIHLGQQAEMLTDGLRALLLESQGYAAQVFEFVALEHTQKNKMILATRRGTGGRETARQVAARDEVGQLMQFYGIQHQTLQQLLLGLASPNSARAL